MDRNWSDHHTAVENRRSLARVWISAQALIKLVSLVRTGDRIIGPVRQAGTTGPISGPVSRRTRPHG